MSKTFEIHSSQYPYDMSAWCSEKSFGIGKAISQALDLLSQPNNINLETEELLKFYLASSLYDISKLMSFSTGTNWIINDARDIQENGYEGYQRVEIKYGVIDVKELCIEQFRDELNKLLWGECSPNRTFIHQLILKYKILSHPVIEKISKTIELVTMGQLEWKDFCLIADSELKKLND